MRAGVVQFAPSVDVEKTTSFSPARLRKRPSCHATYAFPALSTAALGSDGARIPALSSEASSAAIRIGWVNVAPPSCETTAATRSSSEIPRPPSLIGAKNEYGTMRSPFGRVTGIGPENTAPRPVTPGWRRSGFDHVAPPSSLVRIPSIQRVVSTYAR